MILVIDNYDSFTYNLVQYMGEVTNSQRTIVVKRNDQISLDEIAELNPQHIVLSPGPCTPDEAGISIDLARTFAGKLPILGVCLGHQAIAQAFGGKIVRAKEIVHGKTSQVTHLNSGLFTDIEQNFTATRYHSLVVEEQTIPDCLVPNAWTSGDIEKREIMGFFHRDHHNLIGLQFHPESILTNVGKTLLLAFLKLG